MSSATTCPKCGSAVLPDTVAGQCPLCLLEVAAGVEDDSLVDDSGFHFTPRQIGGYQLERQVGAGGMGVVYEARRVADDCRIAIKLIRNSHLASPTQLRRFTIEAEADARLDHPNIVRIHEVGECDGAPFIAMDFIAGESLSARMAQGHFVLPSADAASAECSARQKEIARLMARVARALYHAHERGVLHRDLKPGNILIDLKDEPYLTDFGLAKLLPQTLEETSPPTLTASGDIPGTPSYMSPEQVSGREIGCAADIYGLGALLYALLTGRPPFQGPTPLDVFKQIVNDPPVRPRNIHRSAHRDLETICLKCLEKDPRRRYATAELLAEDLECFAVARPIKALPAGPIYRTQQWVKRNPLGTALITSLCLGLVVALSLLKVVNDQRRAMELDRDEAFDESMQKISLIWQDPATRAVTISARELAFLAGRSPAGLTRAKHQVVLGVAANDSPSLIAQRYARLLGLFQLQMERELGEKAAIHLRLLKRFNQNDATLVRREVDLLVLSPVDFLHAARQSPGVAVIAWANTSREAVIFTRTNSGIERLADLRGKSIAFPDPDLSLTVWAKARLLAAGLRTSDLGACTNLVYLDVESAPTSSTTAEALNSVLRGEWDAGVVHRTRVERYRHLGVRILDQFPQTPNVLAAREGLDPQLVAALRSTIHAHEESSAWPDSKFVTDPPAENGASTLQLLEALRRAMEQAEQFEKRL